MQQKITYLDYAAATPVDKAVLEAMQPYFSDYFYNPSALYLAAKNVKSAVTEARQTVARILGVKPSEIIFTAGGTEANNLCINGIMSQYSNKTLLVSSVEHESVLAPAEQYSHAKLAVTKQGVLDTENLRSKITDETVLISVMYANNEIGTVQPIKEVVRIAHDIRRERQKRQIDLPLYVHTDAAQAPNYLPLHVHELGVDFMTLNGGKIYGPKQTGVLFVRTGITLNPQILGGGQERSLRSGTENVPGIVGFAKALESATKQQSAEVKRLSKLQRLLIQLLEAELPQAVVNGTLKQRLPNNVHITIPGTDNERVLMELDERGIMCATGSACSASNDEPSHVLAAIGLSDAEARSSLRFSMGKFTSEEDIHRTIKALAEICL